MNKVMLVGRLVRDPETRYTQGKESMAVCRFTLAANRKYAREGEAQADFINIVAFGKTAEFISKYFVKGMAIGLSGRIQTRSYEDNGGQKRTAFEVICEECEFVERKAESGGAKSTVGAGKNTVGAGKKQQAKQTREEYDDWDGYLPF